MAAILCAAGVGLAQRHPVHPVVDTSARVIAIPVVEAANMMTQQRVWVFTPPAGSTAYGLGGLGEGRRVWALLPSCTEPNPDDPRDPCPVDHMEVQLITGSGDIHTTSPQPVGGESTRRVQSFVVPPSAGQVRFRIMRHDGTVRYEAAVDSAQLHNLAPPEGQPSGSGFAFELTRYPAR